MNRPLFDADAKRTYADAFERALRHAAIHVERDEACEIAHQIAVAVVRRHAAGDADRIAPTGPVQSVDAFIHRAVANRLRNLWRAARRRTSAERLYQHERGMVAPAWTQPGADLESDELHRVIEQAVDAMPAAMRRVFVLVRRDQRSYKEAAAELGIGVGTVHTQLTRASALLRQAVADYRAAGLERDATPSRTAGARS